jgi:hypothetical protein
MIHLGIGVVTIALTFVALCVISFAFPEAPRVSALFAVGSFTALASASSVLAYIIGMRL